MDVAASAQAFGGLVTSLGGLRGPLSAARPEASLQSSEPGQPSGSAAAGEAQQPENGRQQPKHRKPYTISKARERWSEEEHQRFVEAVRLHGRAWRKIEEHIGTKTAVQIRSHAQKFFNKLEKKKEAGEVPGEEEDIMIPPPRPKRKAAKPYPRKDGVSSSGGGLSGTSQLQQPLQQQQPASSGLTLGALQQHVAAAAAASQQQQQQQQGGFLPSLLPASLQYALGGLLNGLSHAQPQPAQAQPQAQQQQHGGAGEVTDATVAAVTAAASAAAAAAAAAVVAAAGHEVQSHMQIHPPSCFPFFGLPPSAFAQLSPAGAPALDQAALLAEHAASATEAAFRFGGSAAAAAAAEAAADAPAAAAAAAAAAVATELEAGAGGGDRALVEATGTTDGTHISARDAQLRGSDGDSACSRETDTCPSLTMDVTWQSKLHQQQSIQHDAPSSPSATATRGLSGFQAGGFDACQLQWGLGGRCAPLAGADMGALAVLNSQLYLAAAGQQLQPRAQPAADAVAGAHAKCRRNAPSVNSGSTGPLPAAKRELDASQEGLPASKKAAHEGSDTNDDGLEATPSSPSIQDKALKAASQPSATHGGNTSGSNESDASKRRTGTATQGEGSNPISVKDSNTATHTNGGCSNGNGHGNGTSAFTPAGLHHHSHHGHHSGQPPGSHRAHHCASHPAAPAGSSVPNGHHHHHHHGSHPGAAATGEGSNGGNGTSGTNGASGRDETGRSSSDLEGPSQQQLQQRHQQHDAATAAAAAAAAAAEEREDAATAGGGLLQQQHTETAQLQALLASLHGCNPLVQAYGAAAAAAATAQHMYAMQQQCHELGPGAAALGAAHNPLAAAVQQHLSSCVGGGLAPGAHNGLLAAPPVSQGFTPWHAAPDEADAVGSTGLGAGASGSSLQCLAAAAAAAGQQGPASGGAQQLQQQLLACLAAGGWAGVGSPAAVSSGMCSGAGTSFPGHHQPHHLAARHHVNGAAQQAAAGLQLLSQAATSAGALVGSEAAGDGAGHKRAGAAHEEQPPGKRQSRTL